MGFECDNCEVSLLLEEIHLGVSRIVRSTCHHQHFHVSRVTSDGRIEKEAMLIKKSVLCKFSYAPMSLMISRFW